MADSLHQGNRGALPETPRILIVDDNRSNQKILALLLTRLGYDADLAANGREAIAALERRSYDLIFMDCEMPEMDGFQATRAFRLQEEGRRRTPVIALTAETTPQDIERCLSAGMDDTLSKPVQLYDLEAILAAWTEPVDAPTLERLLASGPQRIDLRATITRVFAEIPAHITELQAGVLKHNAERVRLEARIVREAGEGFGASRLVELCRRIEAIADTNDLAGADALSLAIDAEFERVRIVLALHSTKAA